MLDFMIVDATIWKLQFTYCYKPHLNFVTTMTSPQQPPYPKYFQKLHSNILHLLRNMVKFGSIVEEHEKLWYSFSGKKCHCFTLKISSLLTSKCYLELNKQASNLLYLCATSSKSTRENIKHTTQKFQIRGET